MHQCMSPDVTKRMNLRNTLHLLTIQQEINSGKSSIGFFDRTLRLLYHADVKSF